MKLIGEIVIVCSHRVNEILSSRKLLHELCVFSSVVKNSNRSYSNTVFLDRYTVKNNVCLCKIDISFPVPAFYVAGKNIIPNNIHTLSDKVIERMIAKHTNCRFVGKLYDSVCIKGKNALRQGFKDIVTHFIHRRKYVRLISHKALFDFTRKFTCNNEFNQNCHNCNNEKHKQHLRRFGLDVLHQHNCHNYTDILTILVIHGSISTALTTRRSRFIHSVIIVSITLKVRHITVILCTDQSVIGMVHSNSVLVYYGDNVNIVKRVF